MVPVSMSEPQKSEYFSRVWALVRQVPVGNVIAYGQVAEMIEPPESVSPEAYRAFGSRWVGQAMRMCPPDVPWQRVINAQGKISLPGEAGLRQRLLLEDEGVEFDARGRIDLKKFGWLTALDDDTDDAPQLSLPGIDK